MLNIRTHTISGAGIRAKSKSGMTSEQITKELINSPTEEVKPSQVNQLTAENAKIKEKLAEHEEWWWGLWSDGDDDYKAVLAENAKLKEENEKLTKRTDIINHITNMVKKELITEITKAVQEEVDKVKEENEKIKEHFNLLIDLIKFCDTREKLQKLKELNTLG